MTASLPVGEPTARSPISWFVQTIFIALGFTAIDLLWLLKPGVESTQHALYHWSGGFKSLFYSIAIDTVAFWAALSLLLIIARKPGRTRVAIWAGLLLLMPWVVLQNLCLLVWNASTHQWDRVLFLGACLPPHASPRCGGPPWRHALRRLSRSPLPFWSSPVYSESFCSADSRCTHAKRAC